VVAINLHDPVLLTQIVEKLEQICTSDRHYQRLAADLTSSFDLQDSDWQWLRVLASW
jgi:hypothetical protein